MLENEQSIQMSPRMHRLINKSYTLKEAFIRFCLSVRVFSLCIMSVKTQRKSWLFNFAIKNANGASFEFPMTCLVPVRLRHTKCFLSVPPQVTHCVTLSALHIILIKTFWRFWKVSSDLLKVVLLWHHWLIDGWFKSLANKYNLYFIFSFWNMICAKGFLNGGKQELFHHCYGFLWKRNYWKSWEKI